MTAEEVLRESEGLALENNQIVSHVTGKNIDVKKIKKAKSLGAMGFITLMLVVFAVLFSSGNLIPSALSERLIEETDVQYADAVGSKQVVFQQAMREGNLPENTVAILKEKGVEVGYIESGEFIEANEHEGGLVLKMKDKIITTDDFIREVSTDVDLYNALNEATYSRAAYYFDDAAKEVFREIGTTRNNYTSETDFNEVMDQLMGNGSQVNVNNVEAITGEGEDGKAYAEYQSTGTVAKSSGGATEFIRDVGAQNVAGSATEATLNSADALKVADTISEEQRSELFFLGIMENISKMKEGEGSEAKVNEAMNYLYETRENEVVDVKTGEIIKVKGTAFDSPSLYAILAGTKVNSAAVENYSSDRILKTVENILGTNNGNEAIKGTVASTNSGLKGSVGRFLTTSGEGASIETLNAVTKTVDNSLVNNSFKTIGGVDAGEFLVKGAVNTGKRLAMASGGTAGDAAAITEYARMTSTVLAMDAAADRLNRSPFDVTSKNTFLGSIMYKLAVASTGVSKTLFSGVKTFSSTVNNAIVSLIPNSYADEANGYLTEFGACETYSTIGVVGSPQCAEIATFDTSTLNDPFNNSEFIEFINNNTTLSASGKRTINNGSTLANFILYNNKRKTPLGVVDGGILDSLGSGSSSVPFVADIVGMIQGFLGASESDKRIASGAEYVNSSSNSSWQTYKYAQRYVSLARATESLRRYAGGSSAYNNIYGFEGEQNPVIAFLDEYYAILYPQH
ncbi:hypothetical protein IKG05_00160 [Candidatus Saccharibacteria bacterium]|nr:hypothetical protein [Candidatus Saccharibacteria bacterium]